MNPQQNWLSENLGHTYAPFLPPNVNHFEPGRINMRHAYGVASVSPPSMGALDYAVKTAPSLNVGDVKADIKKVLDEQYSSFFVGDKPSPVRQEYKDIGTLIYGDIGPTNHRNHVHIDLTKKEPTMDRTASIKSRLAALESELAERESFGEDTYTDGSVLKFKADFNGEKSYTYAAVKADGRWYLTGRETGARSWSDLVDFFITCHVTKVWGMAKAVRLV